MNHCVQFHPVLSSKRYGVCDDATHEADVPDGGWNKHRHAEHTKEAAAHQYCGMCWFLVALRKLIPSTLRLQKVLMV
jgi:hypothetical protein